MQKINHILIVPDGNRRYALQKNIDLPVVYKFISDDITTKLIKYLVIEKKINEMSFFAISRSNVINRKNEDLQPIFDAQIEAYQNWTKNKAMTEHIKFNFIGDFSVLPKDYVTAAKNLEEKTKKNKNGKCNLLVAYDGNWEIIEAAKKAAEKKDLNIENFDKYLLIKTPIDLIIRTGGETRYSGAPLWQAEFAELYFSKKYYPELTAEEMETILKDYNDRQRRYGK